MTNYSIKLKPKLFDLFQHCELKCNAGCCHWDAFDFSTLWLSQWCKFRDRETISIARLEIAEIQEDLTGREPESKVGIKDFFSPDVASLREHLSSIDQVIESNCKLRE